MFLLIDGVHGLKNTEETDMRQLYQHKNINTVKNE